MYIVKISLGVIYVKKYIKYIIITVFSLLLLCVGIVYYFLQEDNLKWLLNRELSKILATEFSEPEHIEISFWNKSIVLSHMKLLDTKKRSFLEIEKISIKLKSLLFPKLSMVEIEQPQINIYYEDDKWNFDDLIIKKKQKKSKKTQKKDYFNIYQLKYELEKYLAKHFSFKITKAYFSLQAFSIFTEPIAIKNLNFALHKDNICYDLAINADETPIGMVNIKSKYDKQKHLSIISDDVYIVWDTWRKLIVPIPEEIQFHGETVIKNINVSMSSKEIVCSCFINQKKSSIKLPQLLAPITNIQGDVFLQYTINAKQIWDLQVNLDNGSIHADNDGLKLENVCIQSQFNAEGITIQQGKFTLFQSDFFIKPNAKIAWNGDILKPFEIDFPNFVVDFHMLKIFTVEVDDIWDVAKFLQPKGVLKGTISFEKNLFHNLPIVHSTVIDISLIIEEIPLPMRAVDATITFKDKIITFDVKEAYTIAYHTPITGHGFVTPLGHGQGVAYEIFFNVYDVPLKDPTYHVFADEKDPDSWLKDVQEIWDSLSPTPEGKMDVIGKVYRQPNTPKKPKFDITLTVKDASVEYDEFPYRVEHACGKVHLTHEKVDFQNLSCKDSKNTEISLTGNLFLKSGSKPGVQIQINAKNAMLDEKLLRAIGAEFNDVWQQFSPSGSFDISVDVKKPIGTAKIKWNAFLTLKDASLCFEDFPYPVHHLHGNVAFSPERATFSNVQGRHNKNILKVAGEWTPENFDIHITSDHFLIEDDLYNSLPQDGKELWKQFQVQGNTKVKVHVLKEEDKDIVWDTEISLINIQGKYLEFPYELQNLQGLVTFNHESHAQFNLKNHTDKINVNISGEYTKDKFSLLVHARDLSLDNDLYNALTKEHQNIWQKLNPTGKMDVKFNYSKEENIAQQKISLFPNGVSVTYEGFPYTVTNIKSKKNGGIFIADNAISIKELYGKHNQANIMIKGNIDTFEDNTQLLDLVVHGKNIEIEEEFQNALAYLFPNFMKSMKLKGHLSEVIYNMQYHIKPNNDYTTFSLLCKNLNTDITEHQLFEKMQGDLSLKGFIVQNQTKMQGNFSHGNVGMKGFLFNDVSCSINLFNNYLMLESITGHFYQGDIAGHVALDTSSYGAYQGSFTVQNSSLQEIAATFQSDEDKEKEKSNISGLLHGKCSFQGNTFDIKTLTGQGKITLNNGQIWELPLFLAILHILAVVDIFSLPSRPAVRQGDINFSISDEKFVISAMNFNTALLSLSGGGTIDFTGNLNLNILTHFAPSILPKIPLIDKLYNSLHLLPIYITGTWKKPKLKLFK